MEHQDSIANELYALARAGDLESLERSFHGGAIVDIRSSLGSTPLVGAVAGNHVDAARFLLEKGADPNAVFDDAEEMSAHGWYQPALLHFVAWCGTDEMMELLLSHGARVDVVDKQGNTLLLNATRANAPGKLRLLLAHGANVNDRTNEGETALHVCARHGFVDCTEELIAGGADINARRASDGSTSLHLASFLGNERVVKVLIQHGADIHARDTCGNTPLHEATFGGYACVDELLSAGSDVEAKDNDGATPLWHAAATSQDVRALRTLLAAGADVNASSHEGVTPLMCAVRDPHFALALLDRGADVNAVSDRNETALHVAGCWGHVEVVDRLILAGVNISLRNRENLSASDYARRFGHDHIAEILDQK